MLLQNLWLHPCNGPVARQRPRFLLYLWIPWFHHDKSWHTTSRSCKSHNTRCSSHHIIFANSHPLHLLLQSARSYPWDHLALPCCRATLALLCQLLLWYLVPQLTIWAPTLLQPRFPSPPPPKGQLLCYLQASPLNSPPSLPPVMWTMT